MVSETNNTVSSITICPGTLRHAEQFDEQGNKYNGLIIENGINASFALTPESIIIRPEVAIKYRQESEKSDGNNATRDGHSPTEPTTTPKPEEQPTQDPVLPKRFTGSVSISSDRPARHLSNIIDGIYEQLNIIEGAEISMTLEIHAEVPDGIDNSKRRTLLENAETLKFSHKDVR